MSPNRRSSHAGIWLFAYLAFVVYGSLLPFDYRPIPFEQAINQFLHIRYLDLGVVSRADWIANILLYMPLAYLAVDWATASRGIATTHRAPIGGMVFAIVLSLGTALAVEFLQIFFAPRTVSLNDLLAEGIGTVLGLFLWARYHRTFRQLVDDFRHADAHSVHAAIILYLIAYLALALFPFDLLVSGAEWRGKLASGRVAWILADNCTGLRCLVQLLAEAAAIAPLGLLLALANPRLRLTRVAALGLALGIALELLQLAIASGTSQGMSVVMRVVGLVGGAWVGRSLPRLSLQAVANRIRWTTLLLTIPYLFALTWLNGWWSEHWLEPSEAINRLAELKLLPLYYHYFSTETHAVASVLSQLGMYAPVGMAYWAQTYSRRSLAAVRLLPLALVTASLSLFVELGKLAVPGRHPDLSNLFFAVGGALISYLALSWLSRRISGQSQPAVADPSTLRADEAPESFPATAAAAPQTWLILGLLALGLAAGLARHPYGPWLPAIGLSGYGLLLLKRPWAWLLVIPATLPLVDLSPFAGRQLLDVFDLIVLTSLLVGYWRLSPLRKRSWPRHTLAIAYLTLWASWLLAFWLGIQPYGEAVTLGLGASHSPLEAWMVGKGLFWALLAVPLLRRVPSEQTTTALRMILHGLFIGLTLEVIYILWERHIFTGLFDFANVYRVTGTFASMHTGGAYIEAFLALAFPTSIMMMTGRGKRWARPLGLFVMAASVYGMAVTFSRGGYAGLAMATVVTLLGLAIGAKRFGRRLGRAIVVASVVLLVVGLPVLSGDFAQQRLSQSAKDLDIRLDHWTHALAMLQQPTSALVTGKGFGSYPRSYLATAGPVQQPATFALIEESGKKFLRLTPGKPLYLDQAVDIGPHQAYGIAIEVRFPFGKGELSIPLCEKDLLYSFTCQWLRFPATDGIDGWQRLTLGFDSQSLGAGGAWPHRPVRLSLYNSGTLGPVDVATVRLRAADGADLLQNGDFSQGLDHWLYVTDQDLAWHIHQQAVETYFAQGLLGLLGVTLLLFGALRVLRRGIMGGCTDAAVLLGAIVGFLVVGLLGSTVDSARSSMLFYFVVFAAALITEKGRRRRVSLSRRRGFSYPGTDAAANRSAISSASAAVAASSKSATRSKPAGFP